jgi:carboxypeptidase C (cathepsin A)
MEIGPYRVAKGDKLVPNNGSWHEFANLLFVDNPVGTGFSYVDTDSFLHELDEMADQFVQFLEKFFSLFPQYDSDDVGTYSLVKALETLTSHRSTSLASPMLDNTFLTLPRRSSPAIRQSPTPPGTSKDC